jgi:serine/threonine protein kinase/tetratricopeptide (TPR) repeat protein
MPTNDSLTELAGAVADDTTIDWVRAEAAASSAELRSAIHQLRIVADIATVHRRAADSVSAPTRETFNPSPACWGSLELRREIGSGHFGTVYVAWDPDLERQVALKLLRDSDRTAAVIQEGRMLARVRHPNVVTVFGVNQHAGVLGLWMEWIDGITLKETLSAHGVFNPREAALIGIDLCRAVAAVHRAGLLHRDIKSQNVMREAATGRLVLMDFGAGKVRSEHSPPWRMVGTPLYMAPEVLAGEPPTIASDIYSVGVLLFHLLTARHPVEGATCDEIGMVHKREGSTPITDLRPDVPLGLAKVIQCALAPEPARRYRSAGTMQQDLLSTFELDLPSGLPARVVSGPARQPVAIAVLPFENLGPDQDLEYFCNGLAEELLTGLGKVGGLRVASRTSSFSVKHATTDVKAICRQLDVQAVLEGTVRKSGDRLRINAQLVSAEDGCHLWSEGYDRRIEDVFAVQDEIARSVVDRLKITLAEVPTRPLIRRYTDNPRAYELYLKGRFYWLRRYHGGLQQAVEYFGKALEEDAGYALAHAGVADTYVFMGFYLLLPPRAAFARASEAVHRALAIDPDLPEAHTSLALIRLGDDWDWPEAERDFARALELDPSQALARIYWSWLMVLTGDSAAGVVNARAAQELEPMSPLVNSGVAYTLFLSRRFEEAVQECEKSLEVDPNFIIAIYVMAMCRAEQGRLREAVELIERAVAMSRRAPFYLALLGNFRARSGGTDEAHSLLRELEQLSAQRYVAPHCEAYIRAGLNDFDRAVECEKKAFVDGSSPFNYFSPVLDNLRSDPRHLAEIDRMRHQS